MMPETKMYRTEQKYILTQAQYVSLKAKLKPFLATDKQALAPKYLVRSLYFDSIDNQDYAAKMAGLEARQKIRLRSYATDDPHVKLEVKRKFGDAQQKTSLIITQSEAKRLIKGDFSVLKNYFARSQAAVELYCRLICHHYQPVVLTQYWREAFTSPRYQTRITFDSCLRSSESYFDLFATAPQYTHILDETVILEVKYTQKLLGFISEILRPYHLNQTAASKYCLSRVNFYEFDS